MRKVQIFFYGVLSLVLAGAASQAYAHEAYVLPARVFNQGLADYASNPFAPLVDPAHLKISIIIGLCVALSYLFVFAGSATNLAAAVGAFIAKARIAGPFIIRLAVSVSLFSSAQYNVIFGPELSLGDMQFGVAVRFLLFLASLMIFFGIFTEIAAAIGIILFAYATIHFGPYILTYTNYLGELIVLWLFGTHILSFDTFAFKDVPLFKRIIPPIWETPIVRMFYGIALMYAGYTIKFLHQQLSIDVYNEYHLQNFFHASAAFIASGAGISEIIIGFLLFIGLGMRWTILIELVFITLSILYFQELLWPHLFLYGISISLFLNAGDFLTLENRLLPWLKSRLERSAL